MVSHEDESPFGGMDWLSDPLVPLLPLVVLGSHLEASHSHYKVHWCYSDPPFKFYHSKYTHANMREFYGYCNVPQI